MTVRHFCCITKCLTLVSSFLLFACDGGQQVASQDSGQSGSQAEQLSGSAPDTINWFNGSVEAAFARAQEEDKPLYLYWGAIWCPPCEEIKQTVFKNPTFLAQSQLFIPVYLDGDTERAQSMGEQFSVRGYPTMIIFSPQGEEVTRIPGGIETRHYINVLQLSLNKLKSITELIDAALVQPNRLTADDLTQLAFYSWDQANLEERYELTPQLMQKMANIAKAKENTIAHSRLFFQSLWLSAGEGGQALTQEESEMAVETVKSILHNKNLVLANIDFLMFYAEDIVPLLTQPGLERQSLSASWAQAMMDVRHSPQLSSAEQLGTWYPQLDLYWLNNPQSEGLPPDTIDSVTSHVTTIDKKTQGAARQTVINRAYQVLQAAHLFSESRQMLLDEISRSHSPYYFMSGLAELAEKQGDDDDAIHWLEQAYASATGPATRFQWGVQYAMGLIRLQPNDEPKLVKTVNGLLPELNKPQDAFAGRNFSRLQTLLDQLGIWRDEHQESLALKDFYDSLRTLCRTMEVGTPLYENCSSLIL